MHDRTGSSGRDDSVETPQGEIHIRTKDTPDRPAQAADQPLQERTVDIPWQGERVEVNDQVIEPGVAAERFQRERSAFEEDFRRRQGGAGGASRTFAAAEPHYRAGYLAAHEGRYAGRQFEDAEPDLRRAHEATGTGAARWEDLRDEYRAGWDRARGGAGGAMGAAMPQAAATRGATGEADAASLREQAREKPGAARAATEEAARLQEAEERLKVEKRQAELGAVELRKTITEEQQSIPVELMREEVRVERRDIADRPLGAAEAETLFEGGTIRVPVRGEEAVVEKTAVVTGEVVVGKERTTERQELAETVRKVRVEVEEDYRKARPRFEEHFARRQGAGGRSGARTFAAAEPHYRAGYLAGSDERYAGRGFDEVEPELRQAHGRGGETGDPWEELREEIREGWRRARGEE